MNDEVDDDDGSVSMIQDLLMQGAKINITTERTGKICIFSLPRMYSLLIKNIYSKVPITHWDPV